MAHHRWTLALILICIPILVTVISAFRVRDLPKATHEILKTDSKKQKCDDCDVNELKVSQKQHSVKIESAKRYDELKKATREKLQSENQKKSETKSSFKFKYISDEDDDDDDDDLDILSSEIGLKRLGSSEVIESSKRPSGLKIEIKTKTLVSNEKTNDDDDDDDDNDDDDDDEDDDIKTKLGSKSKIVSENNVVKTLKVDSNEIKTNPFQQLSKASGIKNDDDDSDNDEDDDDDDDSSKKDSMSQKKVATTLKETAKKVDIVKQKPTPIVQQKKNDDSDSDDENGINNLIQRKTKGSVKVNPSKELKQVKVDNNDSDDDDDDKEDKNKEDILKQLKKNALPKSDSQKKTADQSLTQDKKPVSKDIKKDDKLVKHVDKKDDKVNVVNKKLDVVKKVVSPDNNHKIEDHEAKKPSKTIKIETPVVTPAPKKDEPKRKEPVKDTVATKPLEQKDLKSKEQPKKVDKKTEPEVMKKEEKLAKLAESKPEASHKKQTEKELSKNDKSPKETLFDSKEMFSKSESNLKHVTDALQRRNLLQSEFEDFYAFLPTFAPNFSRIHNPECRRHGQIVLRQLRGTKLWAYNMLDATAKIPSGLLQGNGIQLGDFDQCLSSRARVQLESGSVVKVQGQYCLARLDVKAEHPDLELPVHLAQAKNLIKSKIDDPGHFVPRFSTLSWGVCVPTACAPEDVEVVLRDALKHYQHTSGLVVRVKVDPRDCRTHRGADWWEEWLELPTILTLSLYAVVVLFVFIATIQDFFGRKTEKTEDGEPDDQAESDQKETNDDEKEEVETKPKKDGVFNAFSLYRSVSKLTAPGTDDEVACIHGVRGLATLALLVAHKFLPVAVTPYTNRLKITETVSTPLWSWCRAGWVFTDCFLLLSGALTAHRTGDDTSAPKRLFYRYIRLTPALLAVVLFYAYVWNNISEGPMWGTLVTKNAEVCQEGWWWNMLYVQNHFGFEDMCAPQTHQLALDMQLTIIGSLIAWAIQSKIPFSKFTIPIIMGLTTYSRYSTVQEHRLTMLAYHGVSVSQLYRTARLSYTSTLHRSTPYLIGLSLGLVLRKPFQHGKIVLTLGWLVSVTLWALVWWAGLDAGSTQYRYSATFAAQYASFAPIASAAAIAWVIYTVHGGQCEWLSQLLSCRFLAFISRLSYALYLSQFIVFLTKAATVRASTEFTLMSLIDVHEISAVLLLSIILTLTFVIPMQSLHKLFSFSTKLKVEAEEKEKAIEETDAQEGTVDEKEETSEKLEEDIDDVINIPQIRSRQHFVAHRELLEEIPEIEVEFEMQRERNDGLEEILEEEEEDEEPEEREEDDDLEIIEEEQGGEDELWEGGDAPLQRRLPRQDDDDQDLNEWEWTTNGNGRYGAQYYRYSR